MADDFLTFLHLSDIHFCKAVSGGKFDIDLDIRNELKIDAVKLIQSLETTVDAILITGDIAFAGKKDEFDTAKAWLVILCDALDCDMANRVYVVPGNHDVDQDVIAENRGIQHSIATLRGASLKDKERELQLELSDPGTGGELIRPQEQYNEFAYSVLSAFTQGEIYWRRTLTLNDNSTLILVGFTSTLLSGLGREDRKGDLFLGRCQSNTLLRRDGVEYLTLCHHPPEWLSDGEQLEDDLPYKVRIQLFGHKHKLRVSRRDNSVRMSAGAVHPDRRDEEWRPGYNLFRLKVAGDENSNRKLLVNIHAREWQEAPPRHFRAIEDERGSPVFEYEFDLPEWEQPKTCTPLSTNTENSNAAGEINMPDTAGEKEDNFSAAGNLLLRFSELGINEQLEIIGKLKLMHREDDRLPRYQRFMVAFKRARERDQLDQLETEIGKAQAK